MADESPIPLRWRPHRSADHRTTLYQFVRQYLCARDGVGNRAELLGAIMADPGISARLAQVRDSCGYSGI